MNDQTRNASCQSEDASRFPRFYVHHDGSILHYVPAPLTRERLLEETVGVLAGTQVDGIICHLFSFGDTVPLFRSAISDAMMVKPARLVSVNNWRNLHNLEAILEMEPDPWSQAVAEAHRQGKEFWAGMRFNDAHPSSYGLRSRFGVNHPEYYLGDRCDLHDKNNPGPCRHLDYSLHEVQAHRLRQIEEVCSVYDVDGFELDLTRDIGHFAPATLTLEQRTDLLTGYLREVKQIIDRVATQRGRRLSIGLRVPATPDVCREVGYGVEQWVHDGIMDVLTPSVYYDTSCELPYASWVEMVRGTSCRIYASVMEGVGPGRFAPPPKEAVRAAALNAWRAGVFGVNLFNFHHQLICNRVQDVELLSELGHPKTLERKDKLYMIAGRAQNYQGQHGSIEDYAIAPDPIGVHQHQLPCDVPVEPDGPGIVIEVPIADDVVTARKDGYLASITLRLDLCNITGEEKIDLSWNGISIDSRTAYMQPGTQYPWNWNGMHGQLEASFDLTHGNRVKQGENEFRLILRSRPEDLALPLRVWALRLEIRYHVLPMRLGT